MAFSVSWFSVLDTDLEAEAGSGTSSPGDPAQPLNIGLWLELAPLVPGRSPEGQKASPFVAIAAPCKYNTE